MAFGSASDRYSPAEYLAIERAARQRSEYVNGETVAMAGASRAHNLIVLNVAAEPRAQLRNHPCEVYASDMRLTVVGTRLYTYPDVLVVCAEALFEDAEADTLLNPTVVFEVLSDLTEVYDRGEKCAHCRRLDSMQSYVLVSQRRPRVEHFERSGRRWVLTEYDALDQTLMLPAVGCELAMAEIYRQVPLSD
ncbi:MAG: Uma2 family endonuclease [Chloroflexota bacterium]